METATFRGALVRGSDLARRVSGLA